MWFVPRLLLLCRVPHWVWFTSFAAPCATVQGTQQNVAFPNLWSRLLVYSNRLRFFGRPFVRAPSIKRPQRPVMPHNTPLYFYSIRFSHSYSIIPLLVFFALHHLKTLDSNPQGNNENNFPVGAD